MGTSHPDIYAALRKEFADTKVLNKEWTDKYTGERKKLALYYITARQAMDRLDEVFGLENWWDVFETHDRHVVCRLTVQFPGGQIVTKEGFGGYAGMEDEGDDQKSAESDAFKRAAVKFGIGRYLYTANKPPTKQTSRPPTQQGQGEAQAQAPRADGQPRRIDPFSSSRELPKPGTGTVYYWAKAVGEQYAAPVIDNINKLADNRGWDREWKRWNQKQVDEIIRRVVRSVKRMKGYDGALDWIDTNEPAPPDIELVKDQVWTAVCDLFAQATPGVTIDPKTANELIAHYTNGAITDLPTCSDLTSLTECLGKLTQALRPNKGAFDNRK